MPLRHLRSLQDTTPADVERILDLAQAVKKRPQDWAGKLAGKSVALMFAKRSTRTRVSFEVACYQLGAQPLILDLEAGTGLQMGRGESVPDTARVLSRYVHAIVFRTYGQDQLDDLAANATLPVINALTDKFHPCQALADAQTLRECFPRERFGKAAKERVRLAYVGAGNNVTHSLLLAGPRAGFDVSVVCPWELMPDADVIEIARRDAEACGTRVDVAHEPEGVAGADVVYTDTWVSMGQDAHAEELRERLSGWTVTEKLMQKARPGALFFHCLPAHREEEVTSEVLDGPRSRVLDEAENRLHVQKALLLLLLGAEAF